MEDHCDDCCLAKAWKALGIKGYRGLSIPEEIERLRERKTWWAMTARNLQAENTKLKAGIQELTAALDAAIEDRDYFHRRYEEAQCKSPIKD